MQKPEQSNSIINRIQGMSREEKTAGVLIAIALILGGFVRLVYVFQDDFPLNDGGLFFVMTRDLQANGFLIPMETSYNGSGLPFAYPPLAFYLTGFLNAAFGFDHLSMMRWIPLVFNILTIPVFYHFAKQLFKDPIRAGLATLFFALLKPGYEWLIMGGGLTRSPAMLFSLLALDRYLALIQSDEKRTRNILVVILFYSLTFLSHMEIGWFTTYSLALLWFFKGRTRKNFVSTVIIAAGVFIATSPYWIQVLDKHSINTFLSGILNGSYNPFISIFQIYYFNFTEELHFPFLATIILVSLVIALIRREYLFPAWLVVNAILDARSVNRSDVIPAAMLISIGIVDGVFLLIRKYNSGIKANNDDSQPAGGLFTRSGILIIYILCAQVVLTAYLAKFTDQALTHVLSRGDRQAMTWIKENTSPEARFISLPSSKWWETDAVGEWFPALAERKNALTVQGTEWLPDYQQNISDFKDLNKSIQSGTFTLEDLQKKFPEVNYIYLPLAFYRDTSELAVIHHALKVLPVVFENSDVRIFILTP